jgi:hypothetical protein
VDVVVVILIDVVVDHEGNLFFLIDLIEISILFSAVNVVNEVVHQ